MRPATIVLAVLLCCPLTVRASGVWTLTTVDFRQRPVVLKAIDPRGVTAALAGSGEVTVISYEQLLRLQRGPAGAPSADSWAAHLRDGDRVIGSPQGVKGEAVRWRTALLGEMELPLQMIRAVARGQDPADESDAPFRQDTVLLSNGDIVRGILTDMQPARLVMAVNNSQIQVPMASVLNLHMADVPQPNKPPSRVFRLELTDGCRISASTIRTMDANLEIELPQGIKRTVPLADVHDIEQLNGPLSWLSGRRPASSEHRPYFQGSFPPRMDRTLEGGPIVVGQRTYRRGIAVHSYSRMTWDLDGAYKAFRTQYAIDPKQPRSERADVTVRIYADDRLLHERKNIRAGPLSEPVLVDLDGASRLTLEVDYGENYDVQDRLLWIEPALLRERPKAEGPGPSATQPATRSLDPKVQAATAQPRRDPPGGQPLPPQQVQP